MLIAVLMRRAHAAGIAVVIIGLALGSADAWRTHRAGAGTDAKPAQATGETTATETTTTARTSLGDSFANAPLLVSGDTVEGIEAIEEAVRTGSVEVLGVLETTDLAREPESAPTIIHAIAKLAVQGSNADRARATTTLARWLDAESARSDRDAAGNVPNIVEALGELRAVDALSTALDGGKLDLSVQTLAVQELGKIGDARGHAAIARFAARIGSAPPAEDDFERELHAEAIAAANEAMQRTGGT